MATTTCEAMCIPPDKVALVWPHVRGLIYAAIERGGLSSFRPIEERVLSGDALLWLAVACEGTPRVTAAHEDGCDNPDPRERPDEDGTCVQAAAVTELQRTEWRKVCVIVACGAPSRCSQASRRLRASGRLRPSSRAAASRASASRAADMRRWIGLIEKIEEFARAEGCSATRIMGRKGWARVLASYRTKRIVLEKDL
jgi:hypothetical protein